MAKPRIVCVAGTRPDAIKMAPVVLELRRYADVVDCKLLTTGQHKEMLQQALTAFGLKSDVDLSLMQQGQSLADLTARAIKGIDTFLDAYQPQMVLTQGDTTTTLAAAMAGFYRRVWVGHVEAGLRTDSIWHPFPEEFNRRAVSIVATQHYAPTLEAAMRLDAEGHKHDVYVTGNTGVDAVLQAAARKEQTWYPDISGRILLLTTHRRENWGDPQRRIARAIRQLLERYDDLMVVVPMHLNPLVRELLVEELGGHERVDLIEPPDYADFVMLMQRAHLILTDSGGVQEEAPSFGKPVLVLRETTERPEGVAAGVAQLVGTDDERIFMSASELLDDADAYAKMAKAVSPYGDGRAAARIRYLALKRLGVNTEEVPMWT